MTFEEKVAMANTVRSRDRFGPVSPEELAALPGTEKEMWPMVAKSICSRSVQSICLPKQPCC